MSEEGNDPQVLTEREKVKSRDKAEADSLKRILVTNLEAIVTKYRSLETYTALYDHLAETVEIRIKLSKESPSSNPKTK